MTAQDELPPWDGEDWIPSLIVDQIGADSVITLIGGAAGATGASTMDALSRLLSEVPELPPGRLEMGEVVGAGGMARIRLAVDPALKRQLALKFLKREMIDDERALFFFLREGQVTAQLDHPHVVPVHDVGRDENGVFISMKLVEGETLDDLVRDLPPAPLTLEREFELISMMIRVCEALAFAHSRGVVHGDVKPSNVMVGEHGQVYLMDWGLARPCDTAAVLKNPERRVTLSELPGFENPALVGTPSFMAPEQASGGAIDERTDVFAMGGLLYQAWCRRRLYRGTVLEEVLKHARECSFPAPREVMPAGAVPEELERIILKALAKDPADRYQTIEELRDALLRFLRGDWPNEERDVKAGEIVVREGEVTEEAYVVAAGLLQGWQLRDGRPKSVGEEMGPGDMFGEAAILTGGKHLMSVEALEDSTLVVIRRAALERDLGRLSPWMGVLVRTLAHRLMASQSSSG